MKPERRKKLLAWAVLAVGLLLTALLCWIVGKPMIEFVSQPEKFRAWVDSHGLWGRLAFVGMMAFQIIAAFIPGEPLEIGAGYAFGVVEGTLLCLLGALLGGVIVFLLVKKWGRSFVTLFLSEEKLDSLKFLQDEKRLNLIAYLLFLIPGTPKDVMTYLAGLTPMKLPFWIFLTFTARFPSVITSTVGGDALGTQNYGFAVTVFLGTALLSGLGLFGYREILRRKEKKASSEADRNSASEEEDRPAA